MVARNRRFRIAASLVALASLILVAKESIEAVHLFEEDVAAGFDLAIAIRIAAHLIGSGGWIVVATAFGDAIDWPRLRQGATIVASTYIAVFAASVLDLVPTLAHYHGAIRGVYFWIAVDALLVVIAAAAIVSGLADSRRGAVRASRLRVGAIFATASAAAATVSVLDYHSYVRDQGYVGELRAGTLVTTIGAFGLAVGFLIFVFGARRPLARREARLAAAAVVAALGTLCAAAGEVWVAIGYSSHGAPTWEEFTVWLGVPYSLVAVAYLIVTALGARAAATETTGVRS